MTSSRLLSRLITALTALLCSFSASGQFQYVSMSNCYWNVPRTGGVNIAEPSPEATAVRRYQDYPVSYATGTADISIPLVELPAGDATVSIGVSYHTGAIKRDEIATDIGLGWSMTGLGVISRQINGYPDEYTGGYYNSRPIKFMLDPNSLNWRYMYGIYTGYLDTDYDLFSYSVPGYSGHFIIQ